ncbi:MAG: 30S ribosome-binding factor RbfA [Thermodesulfobacteriota bacterium]|nr:30S ribosome-binding factor RbfA [Thermodesulfobacteriota bacterium]
MKRITIRQARVGELLKESIAELILRRIKDPRVEAVTITEVEVSVDLKVAHVFFSTLDRSKRASAGKGLQRAAGFMRHELLKMLNLKTIPELVFMPDKSFDYGEKIDAILDDIGDI